MNCKFERDYDGKAWNSLLRSDKVELEEERGLMIGEYFARYKVYFTTVSSNEKSDLKRGGKRRESRGKKRKEQEQLCRLRGWSCPNGGLCDITPILPLPLQQRSCRTFNIVLPDLKYETAPQLELLCQASSFVPPVVNQSCL